MSQYGNVRPCPQVLEQFEYAYNNGGIFITGIAMAQVFPGESKRASLRQILPGIRIRIMPDTTPVILK
jgi:hypothetical protein